jgi:hypothetical protein
MSKEKVLGAKQKVLSDKLMLKKVLKPCYKCTLHAVARKW